MESVPVDRGWAWVVCLAAMFNNTVMIGLVNVSGLIFIEIVSKFHATASLVSFIIGFRAAVFSIFAVVGLGFFNEFLHSRLIIMAGGLMACLGFAVSSAATHVEHMFAYAILAGAGHSLIYGPGIVMVGKYFKNRRSLGNGLAVSGTSLGTLIFPYFFLYLIEEYAFLGAMLICGGVCLNCCAAGLLLRPTEFYDRGASNISDGIELSPVDESNTANQKSLSKRSDMCGIPKDSVILVKYNASSKREFQLTDGRFAEVPLHTVTTEASSKQNIVGLSTQIESRFENVARNFQAYNSTTKLCIDEEEIEIKIKKPRTTGKYNLFFSVAKGQRKKRLLNVSLMKKPLFIIFQIASSLYMTTITIQAIFLPAYAKEDKRSLSEITILLSSLGVTDFVGRLTFGFIGDSKIMDRHKIFVIASTLIGIMACAIQVFSGFWLLLLYHCIYGFLSAAYPTLMPVTLVDNFGLDNMSRSLSTTLLLKGVIQIGLSPALGYIKDETGTFIWSFSLIGGLTICASGLFLTIIIPLINRKKKREYTETPENQSTNPE